MTDDHDQLDPAEALMREVGAQLRQVRLERGEELDEVAEHLRIKSTYLFGIEQGDLSTMPGRTYALGFLRSYADYLGFDGDDLIVQIKSTVANLTDKTRLRIRTPLPESRLPRMPVLVLSLAAIGAIYAGWSYFSRDGQLAIETVAEVPGDLRGTALDTVGEEGPRIAPPAPSVAGAPPPATSSATVDAPPAADAPGEAVTGDPAARPTDPPIAAGADDEASPPALSPEAGPEQQLAAVIRGRAVLQPAAGPQTPAPEAAGAAPGGPAWTAVPAVAPVEDLARRAERPQPEPGAAVDGALAPGGAVLAALSPSVAMLDAAGQIYEPGNTDARVVLRALDSSWIRISSLGGDYLRTHTLQRGDAFLVPNRSDLELWTGNAGGIEVILDGAVLAAVGRDGGVVREVPLDPPSLLARFGHPE